MKDIKDLKKGEIYFGDYYGDEYIFKVEEITDKGIGCNYIHNKSYSNHSGIFSDFYQKWKELREATKEERHHLECCIKENKFIPLEEALKSLNKFEVGKWYKSNKTLKDIYYKIREFNYNEKYSGFIYSEKIQDNKYFKISGFLANKTWEDSAFEVNISEIQQFLPSGHPDKLPTFKFNIGDKVKTNGKGVEGHDLTFDDNCPSTKYSTNSEIIEKNVNTSGKNVYKIKFSWGEHGNWITEEGLELVEKENSVIPEYVECIGDYFVEKDQIGKIFKTSDPFPKLECCEGKTWEKVLKVYSSYFKPATKQQYENQQLMNKYNLVVGKYYTYTNGANRTYWFRFKEISNNYLYSSGFRSNYLNKTWTEEDASLFYLENHIFTEITEQEAKGIVEKKWIPKVGDWVIVEEDKSYSIDGQLIAQIDRFNSESDYWVINGQNLSSYWRKNQSLCCDNCTFRKALPHEIPNNTLDSNTQYWECTKYTADFTVGKIYKLNEGKSINDTYAFTDNSGEENGNYPYNQKYFKPSTEAAYNAQNQCVMYKGKDLTQNYTYDVNSKNITINCSFKGSTSNINNSIIITIKDRTKKEEPKQQKREKLTFLKPKSITI